MSYLMTRLGSQSTAESSTCAGQRDRLRATCLYASSMAATAKLRHMHQRALTRVACGRHVIRCPALTKQPLRTSPASAR